jgi:hypothetical protein
LNTDHLYGTLSANIKIDAVEMVQRRAARFVTGQYNRYQCHIDAPGAEMDISTTDKNSLPGKLLWRGFHTRPLKVVRTYSLKLFTAPLYPTLQ